MNHDLTKRNFNVRPQYDFGAMPRGLVVELKHQGFNVNETGGHCTAWIKYLPSGGFIQITDDASHILDRDEADMTIHDAEGNAILSVSGRLYFTAPTLVRDEINDMPFSAALPDDVLDLHADSPVGQMVIKLCTPSTVGAAQFNEHDLQEAYTAAVVRQCEVWLRG